MLKNCSGCKTQKSLAEFSKSVSTPSGYQSRCRECSRASNKVWYEKNKNNWHQIERRRAKHRKYKDKNKAWLKANPDKAKLYDRKKFLAAKYNMTIAEHEGMLAAQGFVCAACGSPSPNSKKGWSTDHCHKTGRVRGILCHHCNVGIGHAKDSVETLYSWIVYLKKSEPASYDQEDRQGEIYEGRLLSGDGR